MAKTIIFFSQFYIFGLFDLLNDLQVQIWPDLPNIIWGAWSVCFYDFFVRVLLMPQNFILNIVSDLLALLITFLLDFPSFCIHIHAPQVEQSLFFFLLPSVGRDRATRAMDKHCRYPPRSSADDAACSHEYFIGWINAKKEGGGKYHKRAAAAAAEEEAYVVKGGEGGIMGWLPS